MIYSRQPVHSTNISTDFKQIQQDIVYNWSGLHEIARETQMVRPIGVDQLVRLVRSARSKVNGENVRFVHTLVFSSFPSSEVVLPSKNLCLLSLMIRKQN